MPDTPREPRVVHFDLAVLFSEDARDYEPERMAYDIVSALCHYWADAYDRTETAVGVLVTPPDGIPQYGVDLESGYSFQVGDPSVYSTDLLNQLDKASLNQAIQYFQKLPEQKDEPHPWLLTITNGEQ